MITVDMNSDRHVVAVHCDQCQKTDRYSAYGVTEKVLAQAVTGHRCGSNRILDGVLWFALGLLITWLLIGLIGRLLP
jgi:hypothetical protein